MLDKVKEGFLSIFRDTKDIHRVLVACFLAVFGSHAVYIDGQPGDINTDIMIQCMIAVMYAFLSLWCFFSSTFNPKLYIRLFVITGWGVLVHRLSYGLEILGSSFMNFMFFLGWSIWIPFTFTGSSVWVPIDIKNIKFFKKEDNEEEEDGDESNAEELKAISFSEEKKEEDS